jgi:hypothetical protein
MDTTDIASAVEGGEPRDALRAVSTLRQLADRIERDAVFAAREAGWSWAQIGDALGVSRQAIHKKFGREIR